MRGAVLHAHAHKEHTIPFPLFVQATGGPARPDPPLGVVLSRRGSSLRLSLSGVLQPKFGRFLPGSFLLARHAGTHAI